MTDKLVLGIILLGVILFSLPNLNTWPRLWIDEAKTLELARNFLNFGKLNIQIAPGEFTDFPEILQTTGYPATIPLVLFFKIFGYGLTQARIYMLIWMAAALSMVFLLGRKLMGGSSALFSVLLIATFASFHDSGRTVVGEIPGFVFLLIGFYAWLARSSYFGAGFWLGLAVVTKPSIFTWIIPVIALVLILEKTEFFKKLLSVAGGMLPAAFAWIVLALDEPFSKSYWLNILNFYRNPYDSVSAWGNILQNLRNIPHSTTLIYFGLLFGIVVLGRYLIRENRLKSLYNFAIIYSLFAFAYYLRSPGWLRYILISELLILFLLPNATSIAVERFKNLLSTLRISASQLVFGLLIILVMAQIVQLSTSADIFYSDSAISASELLNKEFPDKSIGVLNSLSLSVLLKTDKRSQLVEMSGFPPIGKNPLFSDSLPEVMVWESGEELSSESQAVLSGNYELYSQSGGYLIYTKN